MRHFFFILIFLSFALPTFAQIPNQVNLEDIEIKGEANGAKGLGISARKKMDLSGRIQLKSDFTADIIEELPENFKMP